MCSVCAFSSVFMQAEEVEVAGTGVIFLFAQWWFPAKLSALSPAGLAFA